MHPFDKSTREDIEHFTSNAEAMVKAAQVLLQGDHQSDAALAAAKDLRRRAAESLAGARQLLGRRR